MSALPLGSIVIERFLDEDAGVTVGVTWDRDEELELVTALGMLELAKDTIIREAMGELPEEGCES